ncbi:MAG: F0F1 ATP synthase subunit A [Phenylobacterium sp.]|nr:MAG: F0F1 ATP synthase subunit A [Phenylobacterium sp.]
MAAIDPLHQFLVRKIVELPPIPIGGYALDMSITNSVLMMLIAATLLSVVLALAAKGRLVPDRMQAVGEGFYEVIESTLVTPIIGEGGKPYVPFIFTIFMMILTMNLLGIVLALGALGGQNWTFTPTGQLAITATLAVLTFLAVLGVGFVKNGLGFFKLFVPAGLPVVMIPFMAIIELISFVVRPLTLAMRLFGNIVGGHVVMFIFASFVISLGALGMHGGLASLGFLGSAASLTMIVLLTGLELLVAFLQAFIFAALATVYLNEVVNLGHGH